MASPLVLVLLFSAATLVASSPSRIVGGETANIQQYPWLVQVEFQGVFSGIWTQSCAGSILTSRWVLSAAHCFSGMLYSPEYRRIRAGSSNRNNGGVVTNVLREVNHPSYGSQGSDGDISLVEVETPFVWTPVVMPATIVSQGYVLPDLTPVVLAGWGTDSEGGYPSTELQQVTIYTINSEACKERYDAIDEVVTDNMICAGIPDVGGRGACQGDFGGPLVYGDIIIGLASWGHGCADGNYPGVNTAVSSYTDWIVGTIV